MEMQSNKQNGIESNFAAGNGLHNVCGWHRRKRDETKLGRYQFRDHNII